MKGDSILNFLSALKEIISTVNLIITILFCISLMALLILNMRKRKEQEKMKKMGRPTNDPKIHTQVIRLTESELKKLEECSEKMGLSKTDVLRKGIEWLHSQL